MASPLETLLSKYRWPRANTTQTVTLAPGAPGTSAASATDVLMWDQYHVVGTPEGAQPEVPSNVIAQVAKVRQEVVTLFDITTHPIDENAKDEATPQLTQRYPDRPVRPKPFMYVDRNSPLVSFIVGDLQAKLDSLRQQGESEPDEAKKKLIHVEWLKTMAFKHLMAGREGPSNAINTYDIALVTWGMGWAYPGTLYSVMAAIIDLEKDVFKADPDQAFVHKFFTLCGFKYASGRFYVVNTEDRRVYSGVSREINLALWTLHQEIAMHGMWVLAASDELTRKRVYEAQKKVFFEANGTVELGEKIQTGALYTFLAHLQHWTSDRDQHVVSNATRLKLLEQVTLPSEEGDAILAQYAVHRFYCRRLPTINRFSQVRDYWQQMTGTDTKEEKLTKFKPSLPMMDTPLRDSLDEIPSNHAVATVLAGRDKVTKALIYKHYDMGPESWFNTADPFDAAAGFKPHVNGTGLPDPSAPQGYVVPGIPFGPPTAAAVSPDEPPPGVSGSPAAKPATKEWLWSYGQLVCFPAGTPVAQPDGRSCAIEGLRVGDVVLAYDEAKREVVVATVQRWWEKASPHFVQLFHASSSAPLEVTPSHPIFTAGAWRAAVELRAGDVVEVLDGTRTRTVVLSDVRAVEREAEPVYTLTVDPVPTFFAAGVLVHNKLPD